MSNTTAQYTVKLFHGYEAFWIPACLVFLLGNMLAFTTPGSALTEISVSVALQMILAGVFLAGIAQPDARILLKCSLWGILFLAGIQYFTVFKYTPASDDVQFEAPLTNSIIQGTLMSQKKPLQWVVSVHTVEGRRVSGQVLVYLSKQSAQMTELSALRAGREIKLVGSLSAPFDSSIPGSFSQKKYLKIHHITAIFRYVKKMIPGQDSQDFYFKMMRLADRLKQRVSQTFSEALPSPQAEVLGGLVLGDRAVPVDLQTKKAFIQTGLIHLLAASGMNVGIIAGAVFWLLKLCRVPYKVQIILAMLAVAFYSLLTGLPPSIQRAATMLEFALFLKILNRALSPVFLLCLASVGLVLLNPENIGSIGFQFSVLTTFGLLTMVAPLQQKIGFYITKNMAAIILVPFIAQLWVWPLSVLYFNRFPLHSIPLNIASLVLITPLTLIGFFSGSLSLVSPYWAGLLSQLATPFLNGLLWIVHQGNQMSWAQSSLPSPSTWLLWGMYMTLFFWSVLLSSAKRVTAETSNAVLKKWLVWLPVAVLLAGIWMERFWQGQQTHLDILPLSGRQQAVLLRPANTNRMIGIVPTRLTYYEARAFSDYLRFRNYQHLDVLLLTNNPLGAEATGQKTSKMLRTLLQHSNESQPVSELYLPLETSKTAELLQLSKNVSTYPLQGVHLKTGQVMMRAEPSQWYIIDGRHCLMSGSVKVLSEREHYHCKTHVYSDELGIRIQSEQLNLTANQYYHMVWDRNTLNIYTR